MKKQSVIPYVLFFLSLSVCVIFWIYSKNVQKSWANVPSVPSLYSANMSFLGDEQMAYRSYALMLQNIGNMGGEKQSLKSYDYGRLKDWFLLEHQLDAESDIVPVLAAYYFGSISDNEKLDKVLDYLSIVGENPEGEKWRWLGHGVYLARHQMKNNDRALSLAYKLSENKNPKMADWAKQMPVFILQDQGKGDLAYKIMLNLLISNVDKMHPNEVFFMKDYICNTIIPDQPDLESPEFCGDV